MEKKMLALVSVVLVLGFAVSSLGVSMKSYHTNCVPPHRYTYRVYEQVSGSSYELHVGTEDGNINNYTFSCDDVVGSLTSATIEAAGGEAEAHNSTALDLYSHNPDTCENPEYDAIKSPDGSCLYYMKFTWTAAGSGRGHIYVEHDGAPHAVGATLSGAATFNEDWGCGLGSSGCGPVYAPLGVGPVCVDNDGDGYGVCPDCGTENGCDFDGDDCDDDPVACGAGCNPALIEDVESGNCEDGYDNDCDGDIDAADSGCVPVCACLGDMNGDGWVSPIDVSSLVSTLLPEASNSYWLAVEAGSCGDLNGDRWLSPSDVSAIVNMLLPEASNSYWLICE